MSDDCAIPGMTRAFIEGFCSATHFMTQNRRICYFQKINFLGRRLLFFFSSTFPTSVRNPSTFKGLVK